MRVLFIKIFLLFWMTTAILFGGAFLIMHSGDSDDLLERVYHQAREAAEIWQDDGRGKLNQFLNRLARVTGVRGFLMNDQGIPLGAPPPRVVMRQIDRFPSVTRINLEHGRGATVHALRFDSDGEGFRFVAIVPKHGRWGLAFFGIVPRWLLPLLASIVVSAIIAWVLSRPLVSLSRLTRRFADGELSVRSTPALEKRSDVIGALAREFSAMAVRIEHLVRSHRQLVRDVSHDLRSPMARIQLAAALIRQQGSTETAEHAERIENEIQRLDAMVSDLVSLDMNSITPAHDGPGVDLAVILSRVIDDARYEAAQRNISVTLNQDQEAMPVKGDERRITAALENVIRNALRHSPSGEKVDVDVQLTPNDAVVVISDRGDGVPEELLERIFEPFFRADASRRDDHTHHGIGLAATRAAANALGGRVSARNREGGGLSVSILFPLKK